MSELLLKEELDPIPPSEESETNETSLISYEEANDSIAKIIKKKKKKKEKKKQQKKTSKLGEKGSVRGVETMFRSSCRTQLALTALADNKANIMISINGFILSVVIASGGIIFNSDPYLLIPIGVLLLTSLMAMFLAIRAARPNISSNLNVSKKDFFTGKANILFFGHFIALTEADYLKVVSKIMKNRELTYRHIAQHTHGLGIGLVRKFKLLRLAYNIFIAGLAISISLFFIIYLSLNMGIVISDVKAFDASQARFPTFTEFKSLAAVQEASGVQQLADGRFLTVNDEKDHPFDILTLDNRGDFSVQPLYPQKQFSENSQNKDFRKLDDLEGIDIDNLGYLYAITSHSFTSKGKRKKNREKLTRFKIQGQTIIEPVVIKTLKEAIATAHPFLISALEEKNSKSKQGFNIEGLSLNPAQDKLLIGLRSPLKDNRAIVLTLENINDTFNLQSPPKISSKIHFLNLNGEAIRSLNYIPRLKGYLVISGPVGKSNNINFKLWLWDAQKNTTQRVTVDGLDGFEEAEGLAAISWNGKPRLLIMTDGMLSGSKNARYIILKYEQLHIENNENDDVRFSDRH